MRFVTQHSPEFGDLLMYLLLVTSTTKKSLGSFKYQMHLMSINCTFVKVYVEIFD